jgi:dimethylhistidine N-methyltransferase
MNIIQRQADPLRSVETQTGKRSITNFDQEFARSVLEGLDSPRKSLSSRYFYDARGDQIFQAIMATPEYYLTDSEFEILDQQGAELADALMDGRPCEFIELGSGDGLKTSLLLDALHRQEKSWIYRPVDISNNSLELLRQRLSPTRPWLDMRPIHGNYVEVLERMIPDGNRRVFMFLGSNLGNFTENNAVRFLRLIRSAMVQGDALLIGLDLKKDPEVIRAAYNDSGGHTRDFNLNLLLRINRELAADFDLDCFEHCPEYDPETGAAHSFLRSLTSQSVRVETLDRSFQFEQGETIFMEISQKYDDDMLGRISDRAGFVIANCFYDSKHWFSDQIWVLKE